MQRLFPLLSICILGLVPWGATATSLEVKSGHVRYEVVVRTLGIGGSTIVGTNRQLIGRLRTLGGGRVEGGLIIPAVGFESNNSKRDKDVAKILKYEEHPAITFEILQMKESDITRVVGSEQGEVPMKAKITVAGSSKVYDMILQFERINANEVRCRTEVDAKFTDFGLKPPTLGLIFKRAPDQIRLSGEMLYQVVEE
ncbi:MAG: YceI family protein [Candidatus Krumholzibacteria bacterium]|nr:YceI family protein [Candidatus Krumholzibacteria bacterium]